MKEYELVLKGQLRIKLQDIPRPLTLPSYYRFPCHAEGDVR